jgi:CBS domain-containing protein
MHVAQILKEKGRAVEILPNDVTLMDVARVLSAKRIGAIVITGIDKRIAGIISERDLIHVIGDEGIEALNRPVAEIMTRHVVTCREEDTIDQIMALMTERRIRHLPVVEGGRLVGIVSIGDVVKHRVAEVELEAMAMRDYITVA